MDGTKDSADDNFVTIDSPHYPFKVVYRPELSLSPDTNYFRATDWIFTQELQHSEEVSEKPKPKERHHTIKRRVRLPSQYLVDREASDPQQRKRLIEAIWSNPLAFYFYKQRHLFKPYHRKARTQSVQTPQGKSRPNTTALHVRFKPTPPTRPNTRPCTSPVPRHRKNAQTVCGEVFLSKLLEKCDRVQSSLEVTSSTQREKESLREYSRRMNWAQETLNEISDCEPELIIPYYLNQREARDDLHRDYKKVQEEYRRMIVIPSIGVAKFERVLRRNKNQVLYLKALQDERVDRLPFCIKVLLENALRHCDGFAVTQSDIDTLVDWERTSREDLEVPFKPARVMFPDYPGVAALVDLAAMRDSMATLGGDPLRINPVCPLTLVVDHSVSAEFSRSPDALAKNEVDEMEKNKERYEFLKWGQQAFRNLVLVPPSSGIIHQVHLEHVAQGVCQSDDLLFPDSLVASDSHTPTINGAGVLGWGVGGIECESVMLGQCVTLVLPEVVGVHLSSALAPPATVTDLVLTLTNSLRKTGVVGKFVEFFGPGCATLSVEDRATISNMCPEYGATIGFFAIDEIAVNYYEKTGRRSDIIRAYCSAQGLLRDFERETSAPAYSQVVSFDLSAIHPCVAGPKRPQDKVPLPELKADFLRCLQAPLGFKGFAADPTAAAEFQLNGRSHTLRQGSVVLAAITACTNTANSGVMLAAGLLARKARARGLQTANYIKTSLSPGSHVTEKYLKATGLLEDLEALGFHIIGFGCMTCVGNSGDLLPEVSRAIEASNLVVASVLSGNRNFEGRVHPLTRANYLASPPLVVALALAGRVDIDWEQEPLGQGAEGPVYLRDIWPSASEIEDLQRVISSEMYESVYRDFSVGNALWRDLPIRQGTHYSWPQSTYIHKPPYVENMTREPEAIADIAQARVLAVLGDSVTTDHISPIGRIGKNTCTGRFLAEAGVAPANLHSYGARRGHDEVMTRGAFSNPHLVNKLIGRAGALTEFLPTGQLLEYFDAAQLYRAQHVPLIIIAGKEYGTGSSRDWAAKGPQLLGVRAILAESFERIHRSNLVGMGILPLQFLPGQSAESLALTGREEFSIALNGGKLATRETLTVRTGDGRQFEVVARLDTAVETEYFRHGGILKFVLRKLL